jgi:hypothetical protein
MRWFKRPSGYERVVHYKCKTCGTLYIDETKAAQCAATGFPSLFQPGDIVVDARSESKHRTEPFCAFYGLYPKDDPWIYKTGLWLHGQPGIAPYFVVALVTSRYASGLSASPKDSHVPRYHLFSEAGCLPGKVKSGYTDEGHIIMKKPAIPPPAIVIEQSRKYIGQYCVSLLGGA